MTVIYHRPFFKTMLLVVKGLKIVSLRPCLKALRVKNGSISLTGKVGETQPSFVVMPLTVEP